MTRRVTGLIETVRVRGGAAPLWPLHVRRLAESCRATGVPLPRELAVPGGGPDRVHRLEVRLDGSEVTTRTVGSLEPVRLATVPVAHPGYPHKTTDRAPFEHARSLATAAGADDALLLTPGGAVAECSIWSLLWWEDDGRLGAPPLALGVLRGVGRARLGELAGGLVERRLFRPDLAGRSLLVVNAVRGVVPVAELDGVALPDDPRTRVLADRFWP